MTSVAAQQNCLFAAGVRAAATSTRRPTGTTSTGATAAHPDPRHRRSGFHGSRVTQRNWVRVRAQSAPTEGTASSTAADPAEVYALRDTVDDGTAVVSVAAWVEAREGEPPVAVYGIYDTSESLQYVGYAKDAVSAVKRHRDNVGDERANKVRVAAIANKSMATRANLRAEADRWIREWVEQNGGEDSAVPPGKGGAGWERGRLSRVVGRKVHPPVYFLTRASFLSPGRI